MVARFFGLLALLLGTSVLSSSADEPGTIHLSLEHAVGGVGTPFSPRGQLTLPPAAATGLGRQPRLSQPSLSPSDVHALQVEKSFF